MRPINDLRIIETLDEFQSITTGYGKSSSLKYLTYYDLPINACIRFDRTKKADLAKRGHIYQTSFTPNNIGYNNELPSETQIGVHTWVLIQQVMNSIQSIQINHNQSGPPMSARCKLQPRLLRSNPNP